MKILKHKWPKWKWLQTFRSRSVF